jgi:ACR3 family arsenite transporter
MQAKNSKLRVLFLPPIGPELADQYIAGVIILSVAPCAAMVIVWSYLTDGDPAYTLVQVSVNDPILSVCAFRNRTRSWFD